VQSNWKEEIAKYTKIPAEKVTKLEGSIVQKAQALRSVSGIAIVNYDAFVSDEFTKAAILWAPEVLILDESHRCKDLKSKRTKNIVKLSLAMVRETYKYLMTGTPVTNSQMDIFSQFYILDGGETFGRSFFAFRAKYFYNANQYSSNRKFPNWIPMKNIDAVLNEKIKSLSSVAKKEDCLDLPPLVRQEVEVTLSPKQAKIYKEMKKDFITFIGDKACSAPLALTKLIRMQQILSGFLKMEDGTIERFDSGRTSVLSELLEGLCGDKRNKVIVWAIFKEDYATIRSVCDRSGIRSVELQGSLSPKQKDANLEAFKTDEGIQCLIASPAAGGIGINIVQAAYSIWFSRSFSYEQDVQATARNYRGGSNVHTSVTRYDLVSRGTLDEVLLDAIKAKKTISENILGIDLNKL